MHKLHLQSAPVICGLLSQPFPPVPDLPGGSETGALLRTGIHSTVARAQPAFPARAGDADHAERRPEDAVFGHRIAPQVAEHLEAPRIRRETTEGWTGLRDKTAYLAGGRRRRHRITGDFASLGQVKGDGGIVVAILTCRLIADALGGVHAVFRDVETPRPPRIGPLPALDALIGQSGSPAALRGEQRFFLLLHAGQGFKTQEVKDVIEHMVVSAPIRRTLSGRVLKQQGGLGS